MSESERCAIRGCESIACSFCSVLGVEMESSTKVFDCTVNTSTLTPTLIALLALASLLLLVRYRTRTMQPQKSKEAVTPPATMAAVRAGWIAETPLEGACESGGAISDSDDEY